MPSVMCFASIGFPSVIFTTVSILVPTFNLVFSEGKGMCFFIEGRFPSTTNILIGYPTIPNVGFPFSWNTNVGFFPTTIIFTRARESDVSRGSCFPRGTYVSGGPSSSRGSNMGGLQGPFGSQDTSS